MKKMRKLLPAFAMLLVSAIMMSTASFAWFTMNESVSATGMQVQAKATGSLVISSDPLIYSATDTEVDFATAVSQLKPIHLAIVDDNGQWQLPGNPEDVDSVTGKLGKNDEGTAADTLAEKVLTTGDDGNADEYFFDQVVYIGSAGDSLSGGFTITLTAPVQAAGTATKAYSVAIYVLGTDVDAALPATTAKPDAIVHVDPTSDRNVATITGPYTIPSIVGVGNQNDNTVGLKVVIRVFVDGDLESVGEDKISVVTGHEYKAVATGALYNPNKQYFVVDDSGAYVPADIPADYTTSTQVPSTWYTYEELTEMQNYKYINSGKVPTAASTLAVEFELN